MGCELDWIGRIIAGGGLLWTLIQFCVSQKTGREFLDKLRDNLASGEGLCSINLIMFLSLGFRSWSSVYNFVFRGWAASNVENYTTFRQTIQLPSSGLMCIGSGFCEASYRTGSRWLVGCEGYDWRNTVETSENATQPRKPKLKVGYVTREKVATYMFGFRTAWLKY
jgi:hypothetical protein